MRVLHVLCDFSGGGAERLVLRLARPDADGVATVQSGGPLKEAFVARGIPVFVGGRQRKRLGIRALRRLVGWAGEADLVHTHLWAGHLWGGLAARLAERPHVATVHNVDRDEGMLQRLLRSNVLQDATVIAVSHAVRRHLETLNIESRVVYNGIELRRFQAPHVGGGGLLAAGRLVPQKGFDVLMEALALLPRHTLDLAGEGDERERLQRMAPPGRVRFLGRVEDLPQRLSRADALIVPSRWEGFGLVAAEGLAAGVPVIASRVDGLEEVVGDDGVLVPPEDPQALARAISEVTQDPARAAILGQTGRARAVRWAMDSMLGAYESVYDEILTSE